MKYYVLQYCTWYYSSILHLEHHVVANTFDSTPYRTVSCILHVYLGVPEHPGYFT